MQDSENIKADQVSACGVRTVQTALAAHTPGPWHTNASKGGYAPVGWVVGYGQNGLITGHIATEADAILIASAPELLEASSALLTQLDRIGMTREEEPLMEDLRAAIAKATGGAV